MPFIDTSKVTGLPIVRVEYLRQGRTLAQKEKLAEALAQVIGKILEIKPSEVRTIFYPKDNDEWAIGTTLRSKL